MMTGPLSLHYGVFMSTLSDLFVWIFLLGVDVLTIFVNLAIPEVLFLHGVRLFSDVLGSNFLLSFIDGVRFLSP